MAHPLDQKIAKLRRTVRRTVALTGVGWVLAVSFSVALALGLADYWIRFEDPGLRVLATLTLLAALGWSAFELLFRRLAVRLSDVDLARLVQRRYRAVGSRLTSAIQFLRLSEGDPLAGSAPLRRLAVAEATAAAEPLDFTDVVDRRTCFRSLAAAAAAGLVLGLLTMADPYSVRIASARLLNPLATVDWPRANHLQLRHVVERVARGSAFEIEIVDAQGARLPTDLKVEYRWQRQDGSLAEEAQQISPLGDSAIGRRDNVRNPFAYRVVGGDDQTMSWIDVKVVEPPAIERLTARLSPPPYTGWPTETLEKPLEALAGTQVDFIAHTTKPITEASLVLGSGRVLRCAVDANDPERLVAPEGSQLPLVLEQTETFQFDLVDDRGIRGGRDSAFEIRAVPDEAPSIAIERPASTVYVTPNAVIPIRAVVKDDLAIRNVALVVGDTSSPLEGRSNESDLPSEENQKDAADREALSAENQVSADRQNDNQRIDHQHSDNAAAGKVLQIPLYTGPSTVSPRTTRPQNEAATGQQQIVEHRWDLADLNLRPGSQLTFRIEAFDYRPQRGLSPPRRLVLISEEQLTERIAGLQNLILSELSRVLELQRDARQQVAGLKVIAEERGNLAQLEIDRLRGAELNQRQIRRSLDSSSEGVRLHVEGLLADLQNNRLDRPDVRRRMEHVLDEIDRLVAGPLPQAQQELTAAIKSAQVALDSLQATDPQSEAEPPRVSHSPDPMVIEALAAGEKQQAQVVAALEQLLDELAEWDNYQRFHRALAQLRKRQEEHIDRTRDLGRTTLGKQPQDLRPQQAADLKILAQQQGEMARQVERLLQEMDAAGQKFRAKDPLVAQAVLDAAARARQLALGGQMRLAAEQIRTNRLGQAVSLEQRSVEQIQEILDILANRREDELERLVAKLRQASQDLESLAERQQQVTRRMRSAADETDDAQRRQAAAAAAEAQQSLGEAAQRLGRRLQRLLAEEAGQTVQQSANSMTGAAAAGRQGDAAAATEHANKATEALARAKEQLARRQRQAEIELAVEQVAQLEEQVLGLQKRQTAALEETVRLETVQQRQGGPTDATRASLRNLYETQRTLQQQTGRLTAQTGKHTAFSLVLDKAVRHMQDATLLLDRQTTGPETQSHQQAALSRLAQLLEAVKPAADKSDNAATGGAGQGRPPTGQQPGAVRALAELKLLRILQQELNSEIKALGNKMAAKSSDNSEQRTQWKARYLELGREQGELADMIFGLLPPSVADPGINDDTSAEPAEPKESESTTDGPGDRPSPGPRPPIDQPPGDSPKPRPEQPPDPGETP